MGAEANTVEVVLCWMAPEGQASRKVTLRLVAEQTGFRCSMLLDGGLWRSLEEKRTQRDDPRFRALGENARISLKSFTLLLALCFEREITYEQLCSVRCWSTTRQTTCTAFNELGAATSEIIGIQRQVPRRISFRDGVSLETSSNWEQHTAAIREWLWRTTEQQGPSLAPDTVKDAHEGDPSVAGATYGPMPRNTLDGRQRTVGRDDSIDQLHCLLAKAPGARVCLHGLAGVGKTSIAREYAYRFGASYPGGIWFVRASGQPASVMARLGDDVQSFGTQGIQTFFDRLRPNATREEFARHTRHALHNVQDASLLVLDGVDHPGWDLPAGQVRVLATAFDPDLMPDAKPVRVGELPIGLSVALAESIAGRPCGQAEVDARTRVLNALGGLPLAVQIAARTVRRRARGSWATYEHELAGHPDLLDDSSLLADYPRGALAAIRASLELGVITPAALLVRAIVVLGAGRVPLSWVETVALNYDDPIAIGDAVTRLEDRGLITVADVDTDMVEMNSLVARVARSSIPAQEYATMLNRAAGTVALFVRAALRASDAQRGRLIVERRRPIVEHVLSEVVTAGMCGPQRAIALELGHHSRICGDMVRAGKLYDLAFQAAQKADPSEQAELLEAAAYRCRWLEEMGFLRQAQDLASRSVSIAATASAIRALPADPGLASLAMLAGVIGTRDPIFAIHLTESILSAAKELLGEDAALSINIAGQLAHWLAETGNLHAAYVLLDHTLPKAEARESDDPEEVAQLCSQLGCLTADLASAERLFERALTIRQNLYGTDHPKTAVALSNLAAVQAKRGQVDLARGQLERAVNTLEAFADRGHASCLLSVLGNLAGVCFRSGDPHSTLAILERALAIADAAHVGDHPDMIFCLRQQTQTYATLGREDEASKAARRAAEMAERLHGNRHPHVAEALTAYGSLAVNSGDLRTATDALSRAREAYENSGIRTGPRLAECLATLALAKCRLSMELDSFETMEEALLLLEGCTSASDKDREDIYWKARWMLQSLWTAVARETLGQNPPKPWFENADLLAEIRDAQVLFRGKRCTAAKTLYDATGQPSFVVVMEKRKAKNRRHRR